MPVWTVRGMVGSPWKQEMGPQKPAEVHAEQGDVRGRGGGGYPRVVPVTEMPRISFLSPSGTGWGLLGGMTGYLEPCRRGWGYHERVPAAH